MNIIAGCARNLSLSELPDCNIRPTAVRSRKALFDSLGDINGLGIVDLCAGSGALGLEAASRGAKWVAMVEKDPAHIDCIRENSRRVAAAGYNGNIVIAESDILNFSRYRMQLPDKPDIIFADPPYAVSSDLFSQLLKNEAFCSFCIDATLCWEIPDTPGAMGEFINSSNLSDFLFKKFGSTIFAFGKIVSPFKGNQ